MTRIEILKSQIKALQSFINNPIKNNWNNISLAFTQGSAGGQKCTLAGPDNSYGTCRSCVWAKIDYTYPRSKRFRKLLLGHTNRVKYCGPAYPETEQLPSVILACIESVAKLEVLLEE